MGVLLKIAYRNLREHKVKTLIIGSIIAAGLLILVIGGSLVDTSSAGIRRLYAENFTGEMVIASSRIRRLSDSFFSAAGGAGAREPTPVIQNHRELIAYLDNLSWVKGTTSQITGTAIAEMEGEGNSFLKLFGIAPQEYLRMFPDTVELIEGRFLRDGETGILLSRGAAAMIEGSSGRKVKPGAKILLTSLNAASGTRIREVEVRGIIRFPSEAPNLSSLSYIDLASLRALLGLTRLTDLTAELTPEEQASLGTLDESRLFGDAQGLWGEPQAAAGAFREEDLLRALGDTSDSELHRAVDPEAFHHVLLKLESGRSPERSVQVLNRHFADNGLPLRAYGWVEAAGNVAAMVSGLKVVFTVLMFVLAVVSVIIIMNTLVISVTERIGEIGTMRAIGAQRSFIRWMITLETLLIALVSGTAGILLGGGILGILGRAGIQATEMFLQVLFGGPVLKPVLSAAAVLRNLLMVLAVGVLASLYPVSVALRIQPVQAMRRQ